jgi:LCP family protein required for cell wall assembly
MIILIALGGMFMAFLMIFKLNNPLGPTLNLPTITPTVLRAASINPTFTGQTPASNPVEISTRSIDTVGVVTPITTPSPTRQPLCSGPQTMTILAIGSDERSTGYQYGLADSIHVVRIDFSIPNIMVIDFPRDLWVEIPGIADHHGITHGKLNQAYFYGNPGMGYYDGPGEGSGLLARTLDLNVGLRVDHYLAIDPHTFIDIVDAVGGVDIKVDTSIDLSYGIDNPGPEYFLSPGTHHLDGERAYTLATNRIPSTFQRMEYQKIVMNALRARLLSPEILPKIPKLVARFINSVQTDLSPNEISSLICIAQAVPQENILADSFPQEMFKASNIYDPVRKVYTFIYQVDFDKLRAMVAEFMAGIWPMP